jgi:hypothetical protein
MRIPVPTPREIRWGFVLVAACALVLALTVCWVIVHKVNQSDQIVRVAASSADQVERLNAQLDAQAKATEAQRADLQRQNRLTRSQLRALLRYLRAHGIEVPQTALTVRDDGGGSSPKGSGPRGPKPRPSKPPASPAPTATPTPTASPDPVTELACRLLPLLCP